MTFEQQWQRCNPSGAGCTDILDATAMTYTLAAGDVGSTVRVAITATNADGTDTATSEASPVVLAPGEIRVAAAGDIASCTSNGDEATAQLLDWLNPDRVLALGDNVYPDGTAAEFANCYDPTWGQYKAITSPSVGNHEYNVDPAATAYFDYFGAAAGERGKGYYSFDLGTWHVIALNSNCAASEAARRARRRSVASSRPRRSCGKLHARVLASPAIHVGFSWQLRSSDRFLAGTP